MNNVYICDGIRTAIGRYGGGLSSVRADDLAAIPITSLMERNLNVNWSNVDDVILGCANQSGEDNRNIARMAGLLAGLPINVPGSTINRLCGSGINSIGSGAHMIKAGEADLIIAGGIESMSRAPFVIGKSKSPFDRSPQMFDTTMGWRFINKKFDALYGTEVMPQTAENLAEKYSISREDQDSFACWSQNKAATAQQNGRLAEEICPVVISQRKGESLIIDQDEHLRAVSLEKLSTLKPLFSEGTVTAGNASGINDGAAAILLASENGMKIHGLTPKARILGMAVAGVEPTTMGFGPVPATDKLLKRLRLTLENFDLIEINEAFSAQVLACTRALGLDDLDPRINPQGGAIALGHPLGMSGSRIVISAFNQLQRTGAKRALCTMCIGAGQGIAIAIERV